MTGEGETKVLVVYGVWPRHGEVRRIFTTPEAAQRYADDYDRAEQARTAALWAGHAAWAEARGHHAVAARYRESPPEARSAVVGMRVFVTPEAADPALYTLSAAPRHAQEPT